MKQLTKDQQKLVVCKIDDLDNDALNYAVNVYSLRRTVEFDDAGRPREIMHGNINIILVPQEFLKDRTEEKVLALRGKVRESVAVRNRFDIEPTPSLDSVLVPAGYVKETVKLSKEDFELLVGSIKTLCFAAESAAHLRGLEHQLLPVVETVRSNLEKIQAPDK